MPTLLHGLLTKRRKPRFVPDNSGKKINTDHIQSKLIERTGKVRPDVDRWNTREAYRDVEQGVRYFWAQRGMTPPLPAFAFDPFAADQGKAKYDETRALRKQS